MVSQTAETNTLGAKHHLNSAGCARAVHKAAANVEKAVDGLLRRNEALIDSAAYFVEEVGDLESLQQRACGSVAATLDTSFSPEVLETLKGNADQLFQLKQEVVAEKQAAKESSKKMMLWLSGSTGAAGEQQGTSAAAPAGQLPAPDAVKQHGFRPLQLPGSSIAAKQSAPGVASSSTWKALKFWQIGTQNSTPVAHRVTVDTPGATDQQPRQSLSSLLFGKHKHHSSGGADAVARRLSIDPAASWRSSIDGSLNGRRSTRSSDAGAAMVAAAAAAAAVGQRGAVMSSLAAGEGPLSKSHSMLTTKPGAPQEQIMGMSLEIVAEDEREGRDSPAPGEQAAGRKVPSVGQLQGLAPIRVPRGALSNRPGSPGGSFSFNNRPEDEQPHSPSFLRRSASGRSGQQQQGAVAGPLVRSSMALRTSSMVARVDPFEAPEPEAQPFVEQLRDQQDSEAAVQAQSGIMASVRRSMSGAGSNSRRTPRHSIEGTAWARQQQVQRQQQQQQLQAPEGGADLQFLDLDATRAYTLGVHQVMLKLEQGMQSMQSMHSQSEASSKPSSPRASNAMGAAAAAAGRPGAAAGTPAEPIKADAEEEPAQEASQQQLQDEASDGTNQRHRQRQTEQESESDSEAAETGPLAAAAVRALQGDAVVPPLRSGMSSPAASRHNSQHMGGPAAVSRQLPLMGQASMEILEKQRSGSRRTSLVGASTNIALADVYKQTSGNLAPLSSHLSGIGRRSSSNSKGMAGPQPGLPSRTASGAVSNPRSILGEAGPQPGALTSGGLGPLSMQYGSSMQQAKKSAQAAGLAVGGPMSEQRQMPPGWIGPAAATPGPADGADAAGNNKYASSWGILDAGGLSRQSSMNGGQVSRTQTHMSVNPMTCQGSASARASPRISGTDDGTWQQQQQRPRGAAGRYAGASQTPQSPRSGTVTPAREDSMTAAGGVAAAAAAASAGGRRRASAAAGGMSGRQMEQATGPRGPAAVRDGSAVGSDGYESAEEQLSSGPSSMSGLSGPYGSTNGGVGVSSARGSSAAGNGALPNPPAFLSSRPTSAQAAVATQWSPSKHAAAFAQAPAYTRDAVLCITPEVSSTSVGLAPTPPGHSRSASRVVSPREGTPGRVSTTGPRFSNSSIGGRVSQASTQEGGGYNIYAPLGPPISRTQSGRQLQQQQPVVTAVDLARRQSQIMRASSTGQQAGEYGRMSSNGRTSSSNIGQYGQYPQASPQREASGGFGSSGYGGGFAPMSSSTGPMSSSRPGSQQQAQQQWGQGRTDGRDSNMHSAGIYGTIRPQQWQRQQYRF